MKDSLMIKKEFLMTMSKVLFVAYFILALGLSSGSFLYISSSYIFRIELLLVFLSVVIHRNILSKEVLSNLYVIYGILVWTIVISAMCVADVSSGVSSEGLMCLYKGFHAVFFVYAVDMIYRMRLSERVGKRYYFMEFLTRERILFGLLCALTFSVALSSGDITFENGDIILKHELIFIFLYIFLYRSELRPFRVFNEISRESLLLLLWFLIVTISLATSPYEPSAYYVGMSRYYQTFCHVIFFAVVYQFLIEAKSKGEWLILMVPISVVALSIVFLMSWHNLEEYYKGVLKIDWFQSPPLNAHIRHTGYVVTTAASIAIVFMLHPREQGKRAPLYFMLLIVSSAFVFWTGGRAAGISLVSVLILISAYLAYVRGLRADRLLVTCVALFLAVYLAELLKVYNWNGFLSREYNIEKAGVNGLLTGRLMIWLSSIESVKDHWFFGLGPQGYYFMPNRIVGVQPHSMFIQFVVEWGVLGATVFLILMWRACVNIVDSIKSKNSIASIVFLAGVAVLIALTIHGLVDGTYYHGQPSYYMALALAICLSANKVNLRKRCA